MRRLTPSLLGLFFLYGGAQLASTAEASDAPNKGIANLQSSNTQVADNRDDLLLRARIIGGRDAAADSWPSLVALVVPGAASVKNRLFCGATVVAETWVMTAAHCLYRSSGRLTVPSAVRVIAGVRNLDSDVPQQEISVSNIVVHPQYDNSLDLPPFDIALLELGSAINAPVVNLFAGDTADYSGVSSYIVGWGATQFVNESNATYPSQAQEAEVPLVPLSQCNSNESYRGLITHRQICAGFVEGGVDACVGDSGGPLFIIEDDVVLQMGISSYGNGCALANFFGIYTSVSHLLPWLSDYIDVPIQTPEFVALLDSGETVTAIELEENINKDRYFFGAVHPLAGFVLLIFLLCGRRESRKTRAGSK